jgi:hypothetical protein
MYLDNDGMLICENAILGKAGVQKYHASELGLTSNGIILVERPEEEVFRDESLSSLRGKTVTLNHPDEDVSAENHSYLAKGFVLDVRRDGNLIRGDIKITDKDTIDLILNKDMVELSLGYETKLEYKDSKNLVQREIVYNHLALVERGRAEVARIVDGQVTRVLDKQFEKEEDTALDNKDGVFTKILTALGLKASEQNGQTVYVEDMATLTPEEEVEEVTLKADTEEKEVEMTDEQKVMASTVASEEIKTDSYDKDEPVEKEISDEKSDEDDEKETHLNDEEEKEEHQKKDKYTEKKDENVNVTDGDETTQEGEREMDKFDAVLDKMTKIQSIEDADFRAQLKDSLLKELAGTTATVKVEDESNDALEDFKNVKIEDAQVELINFDKEIQNLYDSLDPHNPKYDTYADYIKFRKMLDREADGRAIQQLVDEGLGGNK